MGLSAVALYYASTYRGFVYGKNWNIRENVKPAQLSLSIGQFEEILSGVGDSEFAVHTARWSNTMLPTALAIKRLDSQVNALTPPERYELIYADLVYAAALYDESVTMLLEGISELNAVKSVEAQTMMAIGSRAIEDVYYEITGTTKAQ